MYVYIEDAIIENFVVTLLILKCTNLFLKLQVSNKRLVLASLVGGLIGSFYPLANLSGIILIIAKFLCGVIIVYIAYGKSFKMAHYLMFIFFTAIYGGLNILIYYAVYGSLNITNNFPTYVLLVLIGLIYYLLKSCIKLVQKKCVISNFVFKVDILNNNQKYEYVAFLDSGNALLDPLDSSPIFIINQKIFMNMFNEIKVEDLLKKQFKTLKEPHYVKSSFASGGAKILVFTVDYMKIYSHKPIELNNVKFGLSYSNFNKNFNCNMLLNINAFI